MKISVLIGVAGLAAAAAIAQPVVDGRLDAGEEAFYGPIRWLNNQPTSFGDNAAGISDGGEFGNPEVVDTGVEIRIPLSALNLSGTETIRLAGWVSSGDRSFVSNQIIGTLPQDQPNLGNPRINFDDTMGGFMGDQFVSIDLSALPSGSITVDGTLDGGVDGTAYQRVFLQSNFTGFGDETDGTVDGDGGPGTGGGSEIDAVYAAIDGSNLVLFVAGNLEANGNGLDLYLDTAAGGFQEIPLTGGSGAFITDGQFDNDNNEGTLFDAGFGADFLLSVDSVNDPAEDPQENPTDLPRAFFGPLSGSIDLLGTIGGYGAGQGSPTGGDVTLMGFTFAIDNSNTMGVLGTTSGATPESPDANWAYGSELDNARIQIDEANGVLWLFLGGNAQNNFNKLSLFFDVNANDGQNPLLDFNVDISFGGLNTHGGLVFDAGFAPDYWLNVNNGVDGGSGNLINFSDAATLRDGGPLFDLFTGVILDYGAFFGGPVTNGTGGAPGDGMGGTLPAVELIDFSGPQIDVQDGTLGSLFTQFAPRTAAMDPLNPVPGLLQIAIDNSNVGGVTGDSADPAAVFAVDTGFELCLDLDELGWDGTSAIRVAGWWASGDFSFVSNQVLGGIPGDPAGDLSDPDGEPETGDELAVGEIDFTMIDGDQFISTDDPAIDPPMVGFQGCNPADVTEDGMLSFGDVSAFIAAFNAGDTDVVAVDGDASADTTGDGAITFGDVSAFIAAFNSGDGCP